MGYRNANPPKKNKYARFLRSSRSVNSNASPPKSFWTWSRESPKKNWKMKTGSTWWLDSAAEAMKRCGSSSSSSWTRMSSTCQLRTAFWDIDLASFGMEIVLNRRLAPGDPRKFEFVEREPDQPFEEEPGLKEFLRDPSLSGDATEEEIEFLKKLRFKGKRPTPLYYYRELQNLREPLHFRALMTQTLRKKILGQSQPEGSVAPMHKYLEAPGVEKQLQLDGRKRADRKSVV